MLNHNINTTARRFELQAYVDVINTADAFKLSRLSKYLSIYIHQPIIIIRFTRYGHYTYIQYKTIYLPVILYMITYIMFLCLSLKHSMPYTIHTMYKHNQSIIIYCVLIINKDVTSGDSISSSCCCCSSGGNVCL